MRNLHFFMGIVGLVIFVCTGQYMDRAHDHLRGMADGQRMLFRSTHIYILLSSVTNIAISFYMPNCPREPGESRGWLGRCRQLTSCVFLSAPLLFFIGFCTEPFGTELTRSWSRLGAYLLFGAALFMIVCTAAVWLANRLNGASRSSNDPDPN